MSKPNKEVTKAFFEGVGTAVLLQILLAGIVFSLWLMYSQGYDDAMRKVSQKQVQQLKGK